jgi:general secretion pathway protein D
MRNFKKKVMPFLIISLGLASCASRSGSAVQTQEPSQPFPVQVSSSLSPEKRLPEAEIAETEAPKTVAREVQLSQGYGDALKNLPTYRHCPKKGEKVYPIELNLQNADLVEAIKVLSDTLGLNYAIDPRVKGTVNVRASGRLTRSELLSIMENLLLVNGATLVQNGQFINIVPAKEAVTGAVPVYRRGRMPEGTFAQVISLDQTSSKEMLNVLKPLVSQAGSISEGAGNSLILVDYPANIEKILELIHLIDSRALNKSMVRMVKVDNASPPSIIAELESIFSSFGALGKKENFGVNFIPVDRMNSVLVLASSRALMDRAISWIHELDSRSDALANVHVYHVENYKAKNLANILRQSYGETPSGLGIKEAKSKKSLTGSKSPGTSMTTAGDGTTTGGSTMTGATMGGTTTGGSAMGSNFASLGGGSEGTSERSLSDQNEQAVPFSGSKGGTESGKENVRIIPDEENNLLVVIAPPYEWQTIQSLLRRLDIMPRQVLSEVLIAEISLTGQLKYGLEWFFKGNPSSTTSTTTGDQTSTTSATSSTISFSSFTGPLGAAYNASGFTFVANDVYNNLRGFINLLAEEGKVNILASPHIMAANNQEAAIQIGDEVPILTSQSVPLVSQQTSFQTSTINYRNTGILLKLKPQINSRGLVTLEIAQEVSSASATTTGVNTTPTISVRQAKTTLTTANNQTVVLGGLIREDLTRRRSGIPGLRNVPILGPVFGSENKQKNRTELIVLITPHVVNSLEEGARITDKMKRGMNPEAFGGGKGGNTSSPPPIERQQ